MVIVKYFVGLAALELDDKPQDLNEGMSYRTSNMQKKGHF